MKCASVFKYIILLLCLAFVVYQSRECLAKFLDKPKGVELKISNGVGHTFPHFTFCAEEKYNRTVLEKCGLLISTTTQIETWLGDGPDYCKSPKLIMEKARINASELLNEVKVLYENDSSIRIDAKDKRCWKYSDDRFYGSCHTFFLPQDLRPKSVSRLRFFMKANVNWMVHSKGTFVSLKERDAISFDASDFNLQVYGIDYEVYEMLDVKGEECEEDESYHRDDCYDNAVFKESMETINCTWPLLRNKDHICMDEDKAKLALEIATDYFKKRKDSNCSSSCSYVKAWYHLTRDEKTSGKEIRFMFPETIKVQSAFYVYKELSLIAEIGGYVGLFLGWSVFGSTDMFNMSFESVMKKLTHNPASQVS